MYDATLVDAKGGYWELFCSSLASIYEWAAAITGGTTMYRECDYGNDDLRAGTMLASADGSIVMSVEEAKVVLS